MAAYGVVKFAAKLDKMTEARAAALELAEYAGQKYDGVH